MTKRPLTTNGPKIEESFFSKIVGNGICQVIIWKGLVVMSHGFVLVFLWKWYVVDVFNLKPIIFFQACGLVLTTNLVTQHLQTFFTDPTIKSVDGLSFGLIDGTSMTLDLDPKRRRKLLWKSRVFHLLRPIAYLVIGWSFRLFQ